MEGKKLKKYLADNGIRHKWFAEKIGMSPAALEMLLGDRSKIPVKYWMPIYEMTRGEISLHDLIKNKLRDIDFLDFEAGEKTGETRISFKDLNKKDLREKILGKFVIRKV